MINFLTHDQTEAVSYAYLDICATDKILNNEETDAKAISEVGEAVVATKADLEKAFPWLLEEIEDEVR